MKKLTDILKKKKTNDDINDISCKKGLAKYLNENLNNGGMVQLMNLNSEIKLDSIKERIKKMRYNQQIETKEIPQQHIISLDKDENLKDFIFILDSISAFHKISKMYKDTKHDDNKEMSWYDCQVHNALCESGNFVDKLASLISLDSQNIEIELNYDISEFDNNKQLATLIKANTEYKKFRRLLKNKYDFSYQRLDIRTLCYIILDKAKELVKII